jgi:hypothetical protein
MNRTPLTCIHMDMQNVRKYGKGSCRSEPEIQFRGPRDGRDELHVSHDPSFSEPRLQTTCSVILTYTSELISTSPGVTLSRKSSAVDHWLLSCKTSRSSGLRIITTTGTVPPSVNVVFAHARANNCPEELQDIIHPTTFGFHLGWVDAGKALQALGCLEDVTLARFPIPHLHWTGSMPGRANNQLHVPTLHMRLAIQGDMPRRRRPLAQPPRSRCPWESTHK